MCSPLVGVIALAVRLASAGPVLFRQRRVGRNGAQFTLLKFRTMRPAAEADVTAAHKYALDRFAAEIISVRDSLDLARMVELPKETSPAVQKMHEGLGLTLKLMDSVFQKFGVTLLDPKGQKFDPERHQAISMVESVEVPPGHVVSVVQKGYLLNDRLLRPAMVVVARAAQAAAKPAGEA